MKGYITGLVLLGLLLLTGISILISPISNNKYWSGEGIMTNEQLCSNKDTALESGGVSNLSNINSTLLCDGRYAVVLDDLKWNSNIAPRVSSGTLKMDYHKPSNSLYSPLEGAFISLGVMGLFLLNLLYWIK